MRVTQGRVYDVVVDLRRTSPTFGQYVGIELSDENKKQLFVPRGFAHGFAVLSETAQFCYKVDNVYAPHEEVTLFYNDPHVAVQWPIKAEDMLLSEKIRRDSVLRKSRFSNKTKILYSFLCLWYKEKKLKNNPNMFGF